MTIAIVDILTEDADGNTVIIKAGEEIPDGFSNAQAHNEQVASEQEVGE